MDLLTFLLALLSRAPSWAQRIVEALFLAWSLATALTTLLRAVPESTFVAIETRSPRVGHLLRAARKFGSDLVATGYAVHDALRGTPFVQPRAVEPVASDPPEMEVGGHTHVIYPPGTHPLDTEDTK